MHYWEIIERLLLARYQTIDIYFAMFAMFVCIVASES